ncbi:MAG: endonuclease/exonuclease/phosphatase family protein [Minisyncoccia bacterium]|jgi:endonuclease/exonuclease/phosphatase family metal-dependent hydrolase
MKLISLNTWDGATGDVFAGFVKEQARDTDIFCFQEVRENARTLCRTAIPDYKEIAAYKRTAEGKDASQTTYLNKRMRLLSSEVIFEERDDPGLGMYVEVSFRSGSLHIINFHGNWNPVNKLDSPERIRQSQELVAFLKAKEGPKMVMGDFNLLPDTEGIRLFELNGYRNLIKDFHIATTRNRLGWDRFPGNKQLYADYVFVSPDVAIKSFSVPDVEISDHLPMIVDIE